MAASPVVLKVLVDPSGAIKGAGDVDEALAKTGKAVDAVTTNGQVNTEQLTEQFRQQTQVVKEESGKQAEAIGLTNREVNSVQKETLKVGANTAIQTVAATASSLQNIGNDAVGTLGNVAATIGGFATGPIAIVGAAVAVVAGIVSGFFAKAQTDAKQAAQDVASLTAELEKVGLKGVTGISAVNAKLKEFSATTDGSNKDLEHIKDAADQAGVSFSTYAQALGGNTSQQESLYASVQKQLPILREQVRGWTDTSSAGAKELGVKTKQLYALQDVSDALTTQNKNLGVSKTRVDDLTKATEKSTTQAHAYANAVKAGAAVFAGVGDELAQKQTAQNKTLIADQQKLAKAVEESNGKQTKAVIAARAAEVKASKAADNETVQSFIAAGDARIKAQREQNDNEIKIYEKFGKDAGDQVIAEAGNNPSLLAAIAKASPAEIEKIKIQYAQAGTAAGVQASKFAAAAIAQGQAPKIPIGYTPPDAGLIVRNLQTQLNRKPIKIQAGVFLLNGKRIT